MSVWLDEWYGFCKIKGIQKHIDNEAGLKERSRFLSYRLAQSEESVT